MTVGILSASDLHYPVGDAAYSPSEAYPEYGFDDLSSTPNPIYAAVRSLLVQAGLDAERAETKDWNPLGRFIKPGQKVFVLCNFVYQRRPQESEEALQGKCTHGSVIRAVIDYALKATGSTGSVIFGNAPLQACSWSSVIEDTGARNVQEFYRSKGADVSLHDLRMLVSERGPLGNISTHEVRDDPGLATEFDLREESLLSRLPNSTSARFRVTDYDPERTERSHADGSHRYFINRAVLESDVVISVPKLKVHEKVGITCVLKGFVGSVANKDCLAHHRFGSPAEKGDEYPQESFFRRGLSTMHDRITAHERSIKASADIMRVIDRNARRLVRLSGGIQGGAWHGNDTAWRMALDLGRILTYGRVDGSMQVAPQRRHIALVDGVVGGEGEGPLAPDPVRSRVLIFGDDVVSIDWACALLMGFNPERIPLLSEAVHLEPYPLTRSEPMEEEVVVNGERVAMADLVSLLPQAFRPSKGWKGHLEITEEAVS